MKYTFSGKSKFVSHNAMQLTICNVIKDMPCIPICILFLLNRNVECMNSMLKLVFSMLKNPKLYINERPNN